MIDQSMQLPEIYLSRIYWGAFIFSKISGGTKFWGQGAITSHQGGGTPKYLGGPEIFGDLRSSYRPWVDSGEVLKRSMLVSQSVDPQLCDEEVLH